MVVAAVAAFALLRHVRYDEDEGAEPAVFA